MIPRSRFSANNVSFNNWKPLADKERPEFPYSKGLTVRIRRHVPPGPFNEPGYSGGYERKQSTTEVIKTMTQSQWCVEYPPAETTPHPDTIEHDLHIVDDILCKEGRGAQLVRCYLDTSLETIYAAKIFDPLYYHHRSYITGNPVDVTWLADCHYSREAAAYEELKKTNVDGVFAPKYYGSWTLNMPFKDSDAVRVVRMVLMEYIEGDSLHSIMANNRACPTSPAQRLELYAKALEIECRVLSHGVLHNDLAPRNLIWERPRSGTGESSDGSNQPPIRRLLIIDFNIAITYSQSNCTYSLPNRPLPVSPRVRYWGGPLHTFHQWVPQPHRTRIEFFRGWLNANWADTKEFDGPNENELKIKDFTAAANICEPWPDADLSLGRIELSAVPGLVQYLVTRQKDLGPIPTSSEEEDDETLEEK